MAVEGRRRVLLLGADGQVGRALVSVLPSIGDVVALNRRGLDLADSAALRRVVRRLRPDVLVNAAAYTAVDQAEAEFAVADTVNHVAPRILAEEARRISAILVHYSTDYVFDGTSIDPYIEADRPSPLSAYGRSKLAGELAIAGVGPKHAIFRTSWVYSPDGRNFLRSILRLAQARDEVRVVSDQYGAPTSAALIAHVTVHVIQAMLGAADDDSRWGLYHLAAGGHTNWYEYARHAVHEARESAPWFKGRPEAILPISTVDYAAPAKRPANSCLNTAKLQETFNIELGHWTKGVSEAVRQLMQSTEP